MLELTMLNIRKHYGDNSVLYDASFSELLSIEGQMRDLEADMGHLHGGSLEAALKKYSRLQQVYESKGGYEKDEKLARICTGLKFDDAFLQKDFNILSGGEKTTVMLGKILLESPDILLLDEPTNHLDTEASEWLENYLKSCRGIMIIVSHDRYFLDRVATKIIEVENKQCETYIGNYSDYVKQKEQDMLLQYEKYKEQCKKISSMEKAIKDLRNWALQADNSKFFRRAASLQKKLDKMERISKPQFRKKSIRIDFKASERSGNDIIKISGLSKSFGERVILQNADLFITAGERVALIGPNGSGKTTFIRMLLGELAPDSGTALLGANAKIAWLPQIIAFKDEDAMVIDCFREDRYITEGKAREYLSRFLFFGKAPYKKVKQLSGGERVRLKLSMLLYDEANLLILDEPTNHLDIESIEALEDALEDFRGTLLIISHDRYFINKVCSRVIAIEDHKLSSYMGGYDYYKQKKDEHRLSAEQPKAAAARTPRSTKQQSDTSYAAAIKKLEAEIKAAEEELRTINESMAADQIGYDELSRLFYRREELEAELEKKMDAWLGLCEGK